MVVLQGILDLALLEMKFTWFQHNGGLLVGLIELWFFGGWWKVWGTTTQRALLRDVYDNCLVILKYVNQMWGFKNF